MIQDLFSNGIVRLYHISTTPFKLIYTLYLTIPFLQELKRKIIICEWALNVQLIPIGSSSLILAMITVLVLLD